MLSVARYLEATQICRLFIRRWAFQIEKSILNPVKWNQSSLVITLFWLILHQAKLGLVKIQLEKCMQLNSKFGFFEHNS